MYFTLTGAHHNIQTILWDNKFESDKFIFGNKDDILQDTDQNSLPFFTKNILVVLKESFIKVTKK